MQDEQFLRSWADGHSRFSAEVAHGLDRLARRFTRHGRASESIRDPYGIPAEVETRPAPSKAGRASLHGLAATMVTVMLWIVVLLLATPAPGLAATPRGAVASVECAAYPYLA